MARFQIQWYVNGEHTHTAENLTFHQVWEEAVPGEALYAHPGNRWHVMMRPATNDKLRTMLLHDSIKICYQEPPMNPEDYDTEVIIVTRTQ